MHGTKHIRHANIQLHLNFRHNTPGTKHKYASLIQNILTTYKVHLQPPGLFVQSGVLHMRLHNEVHDLYSTVNNFTTNKREENTWGAVRLDLRASVPGCRAPGEKKKKKTPACVEDTELLTTQLQAYQGLFPAVGMSCCVDMAPDAAASKWDASICHSWHVLGTLHHFLGFRY